MGSSFSTLEKESQQTISENDKMQDISVLDLSILDDLLIDILSFVPTEHLLRNCRLVCKEWRDLIDGQGLWKLKCDRKKRSIPSIKFDKLPLHYYEKIYIHDPYGKNLIENPCGEAGLDGWVKTHTGGDKFRVENPPGGADPVPLEVGTQSCFATSYVLCEKFQIINLLEKGVHKEVLELKTTKIEIGEWYCARFDCASEYKLNIKFLDEKYSEMDSLQNLKDHILDTFDFSFIEEQWVGKAWHKVTHTFENVGKVRYVCFQHSGQDRQFWAGHYGSKMTGAYVKVLA